MVELRKRKTPPPAAASSSSSKNTSKSNKKSKAATSSKDSPKTEDKKAPAPSSPSLPTTTTKKEYNKAAPNPNPKQKRTSNSSKKPNMSSTTAPEVGTTIELSGFGESDALTTQDGNSTTLSDLVSKSKSGVVIFTYPKASTPGCTTQACLFRDSYADLTATTGFDIYGLSNDGPKANANFKEKQNLPYPLLCDPAAELIAAIGFKKDGGGTTRGVFVVDKSGKVLANEAGGPAPTVEVVKRVLLVKDA